MTKGRNSIRFDKWLIIMIVFALVILLVILLTGRANAAEACRSHYVVKPKDTIRLVSAKYKTEPWFLVRANRTQAERPNFPIYVGSNLCIPYNEGVVKPLPDRILDQPAGEMFLTQKGQKLTIRATNFGLGSNWAIRSGGDKLGKIRIAKKAYTEKTVNAPLKLQTACLKNQSTDFVLCGKVKQIK